jgi:hypothetical protein
MVIVRVKIFLFLDLEQNWVFFKGLELPMDKWKAIKWLWLWALVF